MVEVVLIAILVAAAGSVLAGLAAVRSLNRYGLRPLQHSRWDAIIVAGCKVMPDGSPSTALARRVRVAVRLFEKGRAPLLVMTGGVGEHGPSEAAVSARLAHGLGVPKAALVIEDRSTTTEENAKFSAEMVQAKRIIVVSDAYHILRCERVFSRYFGEVRGVGAPVPVEVFYKQGARELAALLRYGVAGRL